MLLYFSYLSDSRLPAEGVSILRPDDCRCGSSQIVEGPNSVDLPLYHSECSSQCSGAFKYDLHVHVCVIP